MSMLTSRRPAWVARMVPVMAIATAAGLVPAALFAVTAGGHVMIAPFVHVVVVGVAGALAAVAAVALSVFAARVNDGRVVLLGMAFSVMATLLVIHALSTPGAWLPANGLMQLTAALSIPAGAALLAASALPALSRPRHARALLWVQLGLLGALVIAGAVALVWAQEIAVIPRPGSAGARLLFVLAAAALGMLAWRAGRTYLLTRRRLDLLVTIGLVWLIGAQYGLLAYGMMDTSWWDRVGAGGGEGQAVVELMRVGIEARVSVGDFVVAGVIDGDRGAFGVQRDVGGEERDALPFATLEADDAVLAGRVEAHSDGRAVDAHARLRITQQAQVELAGGAVCRQDRDHVDAGGGQDQAVVEFAFVGAKAWGSVRDFIVGGVIDLDRGVTGAERDLGSEQRDTLALAAVEAHAGAGARGRECDAQRIAIDGERSGILEGRL